MTRTDRTVAPTHFATLLVDSRPGVVELISSLFTSAGGGETLGVTASLRDAQKALAATGGTACVLLGDGLPDACPAVALDALVRAWPAVAVVALVPTDEPGVAEEWIAGGAQDVVATDTLTVELLRRVISGVTDKREAQLALRRSEAWFRSLTENSADLIAVVDASGSLIFANEMGARGLGYGADEQVGRNMFDFVHPDDAAFVAERFATLCTM
ncbi:MAG: PAS domain S-box protein, partial [Acidimicrobiales bacterium]|nr:PAS domain S-box protein [Acidimicrobiales bacterium]